MARAPLRRQAPKVGAVCLNRARTVLSGGRIARYVPTGKVARHGNRPHQLQPLLGQLVPCAAYRPRLCANAGTVLLCCWRQLRKSTSLDTAGTLPETGHKGRCINAAHGHTPASIVLNSDHLPAHGDATGSLARVERA